ncbi:MAG: hypothetical protein RIC55_01630, partial [Pirellulaceae bacterium]
SWMDADFPVDMAHLPAKTIRSRRACGTTNESCLPYCANLPIVAQSPWVCTLLAGILGAAVAYSLLSGAKSNALDPNVGSTAPGYGPTLLGMVACVPWLPFAVLAVALNYRNLVAWATLILPPLVSCGGMFAFDALAAQKPTVLTIGPIERAGTSADDMHAMFRLTTEKDTHRANLDKGDQPFNGKLSTYAGQLAYRGQLDMSGDQTTLSATLHITSKEPFQLDFQGIRNPKLTRGEKVVTLTQELLPAGTYTIAFEADNPYAAPQDDGSD